MREGVLAEEVRTDVSDHPVSTDRKPVLVVDLDGTLVATDTLMEGLFALLRQSPQSALLCPMWMAGGKAVLKFEVAARANVTASRLPYREEVLEYLRQERASGRKIVLATAANEKVAHAVADHLGVFDAVLASDRVQNLRGAAKLERIIKEVGTSFVYAGNSPADIPIWAAAEAAVLVTPDSGLARRILRDRPVERNFDVRRAGVREWLRQLRAYQWVKNTLVFVPLVTAFAFGSFAQVANAILAFAAFSLAASAGYIVNDLFDLERDRLHPRKKNRSLALGAISIEHAVVAAVLLLIVSAAIALQVGVGLVIMTLLYLSVTLAYSAVLKKYVLFDVITLAALYTLRILAGAVAIDVHVSAWLLAFSIFVFLSLALVKRCAELIQLRSTNSVATRGGDYRVSDLEMLLPFGIACAVAAVVVLGLFIDDPATRARYGSPHLLWAVGLGLLYWLGRLWIKTVRGEMHDDPIVFAFGDFGSRMTIAAMVGMTIFAYFFEVRVL